MVKCYILNYVPKHMRSVIKCHMRFDGQKRYEITRYEFMKLPLDAYSEVEFKDPTQYPTPNNMLSIELQPRSAIRQIGLARGWSSK